MATLPRVDHATSFHMFVPQVESAISQAESNQNMFLLTHNATMIMLVNLGMRWASGKHCNMMECLGCALFVPTRFVWWYLRWSAASNMPQNVRSLPSKLSCEVIPKLKVTLVCKQNQNQTACYVYVGLYWQTGNPPGLSAKLVAISLQCHSKTGSAHTCPKQEDDGFIQRGIAFVNVHIQMPKLWQRCQEDKGTLETVYRPN